MLSVSYRTRLQPCKQHLICTLIEHPPHCERLWMQQRNDASESPCASFLLRKTHKYTWNTRDVRPRAFLSAPQLWEHVSSSRCRSDGWLIARLCLPLVLVFGRVLCFLRDAVLAVSVRLRQEQSVLPVRHSSRDTRDCTQKTNLGLKARAGSRQCSTYKKESQCLKSTNSLGLCVTYCYTPHPDTTITVTILMYIQRRSVHILKVIFILCI